MMTRSDIVVTGSTHDAVSRIVIDGGKDIHLHLSSLCSGDKFLQFLPEIDNILFSFLVVGNDPQQ